MSERQRIKSKGIESAQLSAEDAKAGCDGGGSEDEQTQEGCSRAE